MNSSITEAVTTYRSEERSAASSAESVELQCVTLEKQLRDLQAQLNIRETQFGLLAQAYSRNQNPSTVPDEQPPAACRRCRQLEREAAMLSATKRLNVRQMEVADELSKVALRLAKSVADPDGS